MALLPQDRQSQVMLLITIGMLALGYAFWNYWATPTGQEIEAGPPFDTYRYRLEIIGHYDQLGEFLSDIASLPRIIVPQDVVLKAAAGQAQKLLGDTLGALLEAQFGIRTFVKAAAPPPPPAKKGGGAGGGQ